MNDAEGMDGHHPEVAADVVALSWTETPQQELGATLRIALIKSTALGPSGWALPGSYIQPDETMDATVRRVLAEKVGLPPAAMTLPLPAMTDPARDPRRRTVSLPVVALVPNRGVAQADILGTWAEVVVSSPPRRHEVLADGQAVDLIFDHADIIASAMTELQRRLRAGDLRFLAGLLAPAFALRELERLSNALMGSRSNTASFRRRVVGLTRPGGSGDRWLEETDATGAHASGTAPKLYRWSAPA